MGGSAVSGRSSTLPGGDGAGTGACGGYRSPLGVS